ncbi:unnamed protein product [Pleuronectes platessa]|uniref:Uncharacterized protein n=1 Tax=Pleuronectes platessa TaxID=8262 RepID=A0A9N7ZBP7_PLEPL|nr:unnamed protein product [Pleuronectes platessa]
MERSYRRGIELKPGVWRGSCEARDRGSDPPPRERVAERSNRKEQRAEISRLTALSTNERGGSGCSAHTATNQSIAEPRCCASSTTESTPGVPRGPLCSTSLVAFGFELITYPPLRRNLPGFREPETNTLVLQSRLPAPSSSSRLKESGLFRSVRLLSRFGHSMSCLIRLSSSSDTVICPVYQNIQGIRLRKISRGPDSTKKSQKLNGAKIPTKKRMRPAMSRNKASAMKNLTHPLCSIAAAEREKKDEWLSSQGLTGFSGKSGLQAQQKVVKLFNS